MNLNTESFKHFFEKILQRKPHTSLKEIAKDYSLVSSGARDQLRTRHPHYYRILNRGGHFCFSVAGKGARGRSKVMVNRDISAAGSSARHGKTINRGGRLNVTAAVNRYLRGGQINLPATVIAINRGGCFTAPVAVTDVNYGGLRYMPAADLFFLLKNTRFVVLTCTNK